MDRETLVNLRKKVFGLSTRLIVVPITLPKKFKFRSDYCPMLLQQKSLHKSRFVKYSKERDGSDPRPDPSQIKVLISSPIHFPFKQPTACSSKTFCYSNI